MLYTVLIALLGLAKGGSPLGNIEAVAPGIVPSGTRAERVTWYAPRRAPRSRAPRVPAPPRADPDLRAAREPSHSLIASACIARP